MTASSGFCSMKLAWQQTLSFRTWPHTSIIRILLQETCTQQLPYTIRILPSDSAFRVLTLILSTDFEFQHCATMLIFISHGRSEASCSHCSKQPAPSMAASCADCYVGDVLTTTVSSACNMSHTVLAYHVRDTSYSAMYIMSGANDTTCVSR